MRELFWTVISLSLSGTLLIACVWILVGLFGGRLGWHWQYYVWLVAAARLLFPFFPDDSPLERLGTLLLPVGTVQEALPEGPIGEEPLKALPAQAVRLLLGWTANSFSIYPTKFVRIMNNKMKQNRRGTVFVPLLYGIIPKQRETRHRIPQRCEIKRVPL